MASRHIYNIQLQIFPDVKVTACVTQFLTDKSIKEKLTAQWATQSDPAIMYDVDAHTKTT